MEDKQENAKPMESVLAEEQKAVPTRRYYTKEQKDLDWWYGLACGMLVGFSFGYLIYVLKEFLSGN